MPKPGTREHLEMCVYRAMIAKSADRRNYWNKQAEESEFLLYVTMRRAA